MKKKIVVLIPCYNEAQTVGKVVKDYKKALPEAEIYVYDNNSTDDTAKLAAKAGATVRYEKRQGKGNVVRSQFRDIEADVYLLVDGDDTYPAEHARQMVDLVLSGQADMVIGDRLSSTYFTENKRFGHNFGNVLVRFLINKLFKANVRDIMTGQRAFSYQFVKTYPVLSKGFEIETEMTIHALDKNLKLVEVPIGYRDRPEGSVSKLDTIGDGFLVIKTIFNLVREYKPLFFFGWTGLISLALSAAIIIPTLVDYTHTNILRFPTFLVGVIFVIITLLLWITGLILDLIAKKHRQLFEINLNIIGNR
jgi:glycosyltransferase involved in cell wall biosynthesis